MEAQAIEERANPQPDLALAALAARSRTPLDCISEVVADVSVP